MQKDVTSLNVIYEDNHIIVVEKPVGIPSQKDKSCDIDMLSVIKKYLKEKYNKPGDVYLGLVHRLDRMVSGIMVFAKTSKAASRLSQSIREKNFKKKYIAIVNGTIKNDLQKHELKNYLVKNEKDNISRVCDKDKKDAKEAILEYEVISNFLYNKKEYTCVRIYLHTGRHHQIRVQMATIGHSLYGDVKYDSIVNKTGQNIALFAYYLEFQHPTKDEIMKFSISPKKEGIWKEVNIEE